MFKHGNHFFQELIYSNAEIHYVKGPKTNKAIKKSICDFSADNRMTKKQSHTPGSEKIVKKLRTEVRSQLQKKCKKPDDFYSRHKKNPQNPKSLRVIIEIFIWLAQWLALWFL